MDLKVGDKIKIIKPIEKIDDICEVCEIKGGYIYFNNNNCHGRVYNTRINNFFEKVEPKSKEQIWTDWIETKSGFKYRTDNNKYVEISKNGHNVMSCCNKKYDRFSVAKGIAVCLKKLENKCNKPIRFDDLTANKIVNEIVNTDTDSKCLEMLYEIFANIPGKICRMDFNITSDFDTRNFQPVYLGRSHYVIKFDVEESK